MRRIFTARDAYAEGISESALEWRTRTGQLQRVMQGVYLEGISAPSPKERALALLAVTGGTASHALAGALHEFDGIEVRSGALVTLPLCSRSSHGGVTRRDLGDDAITVVKGYPCTTAEQTLLDLASVVDDLVWEHALETALRKELVTVRKLEARVAGRCLGGPRVRRVLKLRPADAPPTESLLETLMVQLIRTEPRLPEPTRQVVVLDRHDVFVARVDLAWPDLGVFIELDGQQHLGQPVYDAHRQTAVVAATGWLPGRFTWHEVTNLPQTTLRRLLDLVTVTRFPRSD